MEWMQWSTLTFAAAGGARIEGARADQQLVLRLGEEGLDKTPDGALPQAGLPAVNLEALEGLKSDGRRRNRRRNEKDRAIVGEGARAQREPQLSEERRTDARDFSSFDRAGDSFGGIRSEPTPTTAKGQSN
jgi:hypothetical protein